MKVIILGTFVAAMVKVQSLSLVNHQSRATIQQLSAPLAPVATSKFELAAHYDVGIKS